MSTAVRNSGLDNGRNMGLIGSGLYFFNICNFINSIFYRVFDESLI